MYSYLKFNKKTHEPVWAYADRHRISQVMTNLIDNAIKYGREEGKVVVSFDSDKEHVMISIKDDGPGIEPEAIEQIFIPFYTTKKTGSGIGLSLSRQIMQLHGGQLTVTSTPGQGSDFRLVF